MNNGKSIAKWIFIGLTILVAAVAIWVGPFIYSIWQAGILDKQQDVPKYHASNTENLKALHKAALLYHDSELKLPSADKWMDQIKPFAGSGNLKGKEVLVKFVNPYLKQDTKRQVFGYAMNSDLTLKEIEKIENPDAVPLFFESHHAHWNAHGKISDLLLTAPPGRDVFGISVSGKLMILRSHDGTSSQKNSEK